MGILELASANNLKAEFGPARRSVNLYADGEKPGTARDVRFFRSTRGVGFDPSFELKWVSDLGNHVQQPYIVNQTVYDHFEGNIVVIYTRECPDGVQVPITEKDASTSGDSAVSIASLSAAPATARRVDDSGPVIPIFVALGEPFELSERLPGAFNGGASFGMVDTDYDDKSLQLLNGSYRNGNIFWKLKGLKEGYTVFFITVWTIPGPGMTRRVEIIVDPPRYSEAAPPAGVPIVAPQTPAQQTTIPATSAFSPPAVSVAA